MNTVPYLLLLLAAGDIELALGAFVPKVYTVPEPVIEVFSPKGFRVTIPHDEGITLFAFHGNINQPMESLEAGQFSKDILKLRGDRWVFEDYGTKLMKGDVIYYWLFVIKNRLGYRYDNGEFIVQDIIPEPQTEEENTSSQSSLNDGNKTLINVLTCEIQQNLTNALYDLTKQIESLREVTSILVKLVAKDDASARTLKFIGVLPPYDDAKQTAQVIIKEKLGLSIPAVNATWDDNKDTVTFQVASLDDKIFLIRTAEEKLKHSKIKLLY